MPLPHMHPWIVRCKYLSTPYISKYLDMYLPLTKCRMSGIMYPHARIGNYRITQRNNSKSHTHSTYGTLQYLVVVCAGLGKTIWELADG